MKLHELAPAAGSKKTRTRRGRGLGSGLGKTAGRGQKGQTPVVWWRTFRLRRWPDASLSPFTKTWFQKCVR